MQEVPKTTMKQKKQRHMLDQCERCGRLIPDGNPKNELFCFLCKRVIDKENYTEEYKKQKPINDERWKQMKEGRTFIIFEEISRLRLKEKEQSGGIEG